MNITNMNIAENFEKANTKKVYKRKKLTFFCEWVNFEGKNLLQKRELSCLIIIAKQIIGVALKVYGMKIAKRNQKVNKSKKKNYKIVNFFYFEMQQRLYFERKKSLEKNRAILFNLICNITKGVARYEY